MKPLYHITFVSGINAVTISSKNRLCMRRNLKKNVMQRKFHDSLHGFQQRKYFHLISQVYEPKKS